MTYLYYTTQNYIPNIIYMHSNSFTFFDYNHSNEINYRYKTNKFETYNYNQINAINYCQKNRKKENN